MRTENHVFAIYDEPQQAEQAVAQLKGAGFVASAITVLHGDNETSREFAEKHRTNAPLGTAHGKTAGMALDGSWGVQDPGAGPVAGALDGALVQMGVPSDWLDGRLADGKVLLSVACGSAQLVLLGTQILKLAGASETGYSTPAAAPDVTPEIARGLVEKGYRKDASDAHQKAAARHDEAAEAHRFAADHTEQGNEPEGGRHSLRALELSDQAYRLAKEAHLWSLQLVAL